MLHKITRYELFQVQLALLVAIALQIMGRNIGTEALPGSHNIIILIEVILAVFIGFTVNMDRARKSGIHHLFSVALLGLISVANILGLIFVLNALIIDHAVLSGSELLVSALGIFATNVIVFALWYWEIDSPGLTRTRWSKHDKDFQFTQQDMPDEFPNWKPQFVDYLFMSVINAFNGASTGAKPLTHQAKLLLGTQAAVSIFTLALVIARSVSVLGT